MPRVLLLGGTTEASALARRLAAGGVEAVFSYAGRTAAPVAQPLPQRIGGFGGVEGLVAYLVREGITHVVDATHPFAAGMSHNAVAACSATGTPLLALERAAWVAEPGDDWTHVPDTDAAVAALPDTPCRVFLAIGKQTLAAFAGRPHHYLLRLVDPPEATPLPDCTVILDRGPFTVASDLALLTAHRITHIVAKNAGGDGAVAKLIAARRLGLPVILIERPAVPARPVVANVDQVMDWLHHRALADRGV
ncbi:MAG: cobalt-precorrin-6A reductase [Pseudomonadota bacterium]